MIIISNPPHLIPPDDTIPLRVHVSRYKLRPRPNTYTGSNIPRYALEANDIMAMEARFMTHPDTGKKQEYRHLVQGKDKLIWEKNIGKRAWALVTLLYEG